MRHFKNRIFQLWDAIPNFHRVMLRSTKYPDATNIDLIFIGVDYISIPQMIREPSIDQATKEELLKLESILEETPKKENVFILVEGKHRHFIVAAHMKIEEHDADIFERPLKPLDL